MTTIDKRKEEKVLRDYEKLIYKLANKNYLRYNRKYALEDILQEAKISAIRAYRNYDPSSLLIAQQKATRTSVELLREEVDELHQIIRMILK